MKASRYLLILVLLGTACALRGSRDRDDPQEEKKESSTVAKNSDKKELSRLQKIQELLKQVTNSTLTNTSQITATRQGPCQCTGGVCGCCSRILYSTFRQRACVNVTYDPDEFSFTANVLMNNRVLYTRTVSGKNPRPFCVPIPRIPAVKACVRFYNIYFQGRNIHMCINMEGKFRDTTLFKVGLDCLRFGTNGLALVRPEEGGGLGQIEFLPATPGEPGDDDDYDDYNEDDDGDDIDDDDDDDDDYL